MILSKVLLTLTCCIFFVFTPAFSQQSVTDQLSRNVTDYQLAESRKQLKNWLDSLDLDKNNGDQVIIELLQRRQTVSKSMEILFKEFTAKGTWTDINYKDKERSGWELKTHVDRILSITKEYLNEGSAYYKDEKLKKMIHQALSYWFKYMPQNNNWWYNEIGIPKTMGPILIMLRAELSPEEYAAGLKVMDQAHFGMTGQNKVWLAGNMFYKALLTDDETLARQARDTIVSEIRISDGEGIKADFSFQQHGPQQQFGNYGLAFITTMATWATIFTDASFALETDKISILRNLFDKGYNQLVWKGYFDINSLGRQFFKYAQEQKALAIAFAGYDLMQVDPRHRPVYQEFIERNFMGENKPALPGITNYFTSDMMVYRSKNWYSSIKMSSRRVIGAEAGNKENLKGYYLGDGACYISVSGKEYDTIFPLWNWRNLPGVTSFESNEPLQVLDWKGYRNNSDFTGGISNGLNGVMSFILNRDGLTAKKSYFFIENQLVCLGTGITTSKIDSVVTTLNQTWLNGPVNYFAENLEVLKPETALTSQHVNWVYHNQITYVPLQNTRLDISNQTHTGSWHDIIAKYPSDSISGKNFTLKVTPEIKPTNASYAYAILPDYKPGKTETIALKFEIVKNDDQAQIIKTKDGQVVLIAVFEAFKQDFPAIGELNFKQPGLYQIDRNKEQMQITMADPTQKLDMMEIIINGREFSSEMPKGAYRGKAVQIVDRN